MTAVNLKIIITCSELKHVKLERNVELWNSSIFASSKKVVEFLRVQISQLKVERNMDSLTNSFSLLYRKYETH